MTPETLPPPAIEKVAPSHRASFRQSMQILLLDYPLGAGISVKGKLGYLKLCALTLQPIWSTHEKQPGEAIYTGLFHARLFLEAGEIRFSVPMGRLKCDEARFEAFHQSEAWQKHADFTHLVFNLLSPQRPPTRPCTCNSLPWRTTQPKPPNCISTNRGLVTPAAMDLGPQFSHHATV